VLNAAPIVANLLDASAYLKLLVTSRAVLHVYGEHDYPVPPLALPPPAAAFEQLQSNPAIRLFAQRAEATHHAFALTTANASCVAEICRRLDGLPLAIELAAAQARAFPVQGILERLERSLDFLTGDARERPLRQQTLRNTIDWSHRLLSPAEQMLFRRLAVFAGGWTLEGADAVCNAHRDLEVEVAAGMASLVDKSLVQHVGWFEGEARYHMLETLREYALEQMRLSNEEERTRRAHAAYCIVLAEEGNPQLTAAERGRWLSRCDLEHDNFRAALDWVIGIGNASWSPMDTTTVYCTPGWTGPLRSGLPSATSCRPDWQYLAARCTWDRQDLFRICPRTAKSWPSGRRRRSLPRWPPAHAFLSTWSSAVVTACMHCHKVNSGADPRDRRHCPTQARSTE